MVTLVNGQLTEQVSVDDRGLLYGQSVYETVAVVSGQPQLLDLHLARLNLGCKKLNIPININDIDRDINSISEYFLKAQSCVLRVSVSMCGGGRGYQNPANPDSNRVLRLSDYPHYDAEVYRQGVTLGLVDVALGHQPMLAGIKHGNRLEQILARQQWQDGWHEGLVTDFEGNVIEGTQSNLFVVRNDVVSTPLLDKCGVEGVMKQWVIAALKRAGFSCQAVRLSLQQIEEADEVFLTNSLIGVWPVAAFKGKRYTKHETAHKLIEQLFQNEIIPNY